MTGSALHLLVLVGALLIAAGCAHPLAAATHVANAAACGLGAAHTTITVASVSAQRAAARRVVGDRSDPAVRAEQLDRATQAGAEYRPAWDAYEMARACWVVLTVAIRELEAQGAGAPVSRLAPLLVALAESLQQLEGQFE